MPDNGPNFIQVQNTDMLSSNVVGLDIHNSQNDNIGKIQDIAFDTSKKVTGYILSVGGFLGMGTKYVVVPFSSLQMQDNKIVLPGATKDALRALPEFKYKS